LISMLGTRWVAELPVIRGIHWSGFWRGFPGVTVASPTTLVRSGKRARAVAPVQMLTINELQDTGANTLAHSSLFERLRVLNIERYYAIRDGAVLLRILLRSRHAVGLRRLSFIDSNLNEDAVTAIVNSPHLTGLEWLNSGRSEFQDQHAEVLLNSPTFTNLRSGIFRSPQLSDVMKKRLKERFPTATV